MPRASYICCGRKVCGTDFSDDKRWFSLDCTGLICSSLTLFIHLFAYATLHTSLLHRHMWGGMEKRLGMEGEAVEIRPPFFSDAFRIFWIIVTTVLGSLAVSSHLRCMLTNPGTVPSNALPLPPSLRSKCSHLTNHLPPSARLEATRTLHARQCGKCSRFKPPRAHHSSVSGRCITKLDHFCPWVNNEVGVFNHKYFVLFVSYTALQCIAVFIVCVRAYVACGVKVKLTNADGTPYVPGGPSDDGGTWSPPAYCVERVGTGAHVVTGCSVLFAIFTTCMAIDQIEGVTKGRNKIQRMQEDRASRGEAQGEGGSSSSGDVDTDWIGCNEVFGGSGRSVRWDWFFPTKVVFLGDSKPLVLGYVVDEGGREVDEEEGMEMKDIKEEENEALLVKRQTNSSTSPGRPPADDMDMSNVI
ncbi:hypothetical protein TrCOL_g7703 [Triparma columacea]|uniref:Palmitoyltransferase n=1 Tax=Triparma columacea TaxID=722753 RepID=A0A9W7L1U3_9STRA|nr:hypothetical protein TrCOL_g7703 [Triparma columacea]